VGSTDLRFAIADRQFVTKICTSEYRFSKIDIDNRFLLMQIFLTNWRSAAAHLKAKKPQMAGAIRGFLFVLTFTA